MKKLGIALCAFLFLCLLLSSCRTMKDCPAYSKYEPKFKVGVGVGARY